MVLYLLVKMVCYFTNKKDHPSHNEHVKIDLFKIMNNPFDAYPKWVFFIIFFNKRNYVFLLMIRYNIQF
jgi:hypothetical protein